MTPMDTPWTALERIQIERASEELLYRSYRRQRDLAPEYAPESWVPMFADWREYEVRYQAERGT